VLADLYIIKLERAKSFILYVISLRFLAFSGTMSRMKYDLRDICARYFVAAVTGAAMSFFSPSVSASVIDDKTLIEGAKLCTSYLPRHEREYGIPVHLLAAIASTESGRYNKQIGLSLPWPWTINVEGKGYFFDTKEQAIAVVKGLQEHGHQSIDVGCMQVNLHHHPGAFANLDQAFDPGYNIAYAAQFLKHNFDDEKSWRKATADYHSRSPMFGEQYARLVFNSWSHIINKVADARAGRVTLKSEVASTQRTNSPADPLNDFKKPHRHSYYALHMHSISISHDTTSENGVLVIRPEHSGDPIKAHAKPNDEFVSHNVKLAVAAAQDKTDVGVNKGAKVVKLDDGKESVVKGQFDPSVHIVRVNDKFTAEKNKPNSVFVFDN